MNYEGIRTESQPLHIPVVVNINNSVFTNILTTNVMVEIIEKNEQNAEVTETLVLGGVSGTFKWDSGLYVKGDISLILIKENNFQPLLQIAGTEQKVSIKNDETISFSGMIGFRFNNFDVGLEAGILGRQYFMLTGGVCF